MDLKVVGSGCVRIVLKNFEPHVVYAEPRTANLGSLIRLAPKQAADSGLEKCGIQGALKHGGFKGIIVPFIVGISLHRRPQNEV